MGQLTVQLLGVCVHLGPDSGITLPSGVQRRVVYPAGSAPYGKDVHAHSPTIEIFSGPTVVWSRRPIGNTTVTFSSGATTSGVSGTLKCVPSLHHFFHELTLDPNRVTGSPQHDFAFVDFSAGVFSAMQVNGAVDAQAIIEFPDPTVSVTVTPAEGDPVTCNDIALPATVVFDSHASHHKELDYFVTLLVMDLPPTEPSGLGEQVKRVIRFINTCLGGEGDAGCSNSQFP